MLVIPKHKARTKEADKRAPIDEIMKYLFGVSKETLINMLNSLFNENFSVDAAIVIQTNSEFVDEGFDMIRGDLFFAIIEGSKPHHLHIELQTRPDGHMTIRLINYDMKKAIENQRLDGAGGKQRFIFPKTIVIHVEKGDSIPDNYEYDFVDIKEDGSEEVIHRIVPVVKYWQFTDKELIERQLYPLLPLQIFLLRSELKKYAKEADSESKWKLIQEIRDLTEKMIIEIRRLADEGKINKEKDDDIIITALNKLIKYLSDQYKFDKRLEQEVDFVIKSVFTTLKEEGRAEGIAKGRVEGKTETKLEVAEKMILKGKPLDEIIEFSGLTEKKIRQLAKNLSKELIP